MASEASAGSVAGDRQGAVRRRLSALTGPRAYPRLVIAAFVALYVNVVSGALVRVTNSGLGCPDWPACNGRAVPPFAGHAVIEFTNRLLAAAVIAATALCAVAAYRTVRGRDRRQWRLALGIGVGTLAQGPLGGITVLLDLNPIAVMSHFLLAIAIFSLATILLVDVHLASPASEPKPRWLRRLTLGLPAWTFVLIVSGAVVTMSGTHPGADDVPRLWNLLDAAYWHVRIAVSFVIALAVYLFALARLERPGPRVPALAWAVVVATGVQIVVGEVQWRSQLPWWLVLIHVSVAAALWASVVALTRFVLPAPPSPASGSG